MSKGSTTTKKRYLRGAADHCREAIRLQRQRLDAGSPSARIDLNFYTVALFRLLGVAERAINLPDSQPVRAAFEAFNARWPKVKELRNDEEHFRGPHLDAPLGIWYFSRDVIEALPGGRVRFVVDPEEMEPDVDRLYQVLCKFLGDP